jgi:hypothetical protein
MLRLRSVVRSWRVRRAAVHFAPINAVTAWKINSPSAFLLQCMSPLLAQS